MRDRRFGFALILALTLSGACSYNRAYLSYSEYEKDTPLSNEGFDGVRLGKVSAREGGAIWRECTSVAEGSLFVLIEETRRLGGNAIGEIRWIPQKPRRASDEPTCQRRWGWFLVWPVLATHLFQTATVEGQAYRIDGSSTASGGTYLIPEAFEEQQRLVKQIIDHHVSLR